MYDTHPARDARASKVYRLAGPDPSDIDVIHRWQRGSDKGMHKVAWLSSINQPHSDSKTDLEEPSIHPSHIGRQRETHTGVMHVAKSSHQTSS
mmetsp:Transcript_46914/g.116937  ORF Transcript_46914/g.116937 Transcript_46914/m.116937 type:complete len:93 (-) Transcript_46914:99-377(-)